MNVETVKTSAGQPSGEGAASADARRKTVSSSPGSGISAVSAAVSGHKSGHGAEILVQQLGRESRTEPASLAGNSGDNLDATDASSIGDFLGGSLNGPMSEIGPISENEPMSDFLEQAESDLASAGTIPNLPGSEGSGGLTVGDPPHTDSFSTGDNADYPLQDPGPIDAPLSTPEPGSLVLLGTVLTATIALYTRRRVVFTNK
jgi:hypothetical protein